MIDRVGRWLLLAVVVLATTAAAAMTPSTTTASTVTFAYDVPPIARVDIHRFDAAGAGPAQVSVAQEGSAPPAVETRGSPTTPLVLGNATNTGGGLRVIGSGFSASERGAAEALAGQGRSVVLRQATGVGRTSDLLVDGIPYDVYTPTTGNLDRIVSAGCSAACVLACVCACLCV